MFIFSTFFRSAVMFAIFGDLVAEYFDFNLFVFEKDMLREFIVYVAGWLM